MQIPTSQISDEIRRYRELFEEWGAAVDAWAACSNRETRARLREASDALRPYHEPRDSPCLQVATGQNQ